MRLRAYYDRLAGTVSFIIFRQAGNQKQYLKMPKLNEFEWKNCPDAYSIPREESELILPSELFMGDFFDQLLEEMERCANEMGGLTKKQKANLQKLQGLEAKLEAREYHLEDMRKLVFKETPKDPSGL